MWPLRRQTLLQVKEWLPRPKTSKKMRNSSDTALSLRFKTLNIFSSKLIAHLHACLRNLFFLLYLAPFCCGPRTVVLHGRRGYLQCLETCLAVTHGQGGMVCYWLLRCRTQDDANGALGSYNAQNNPLSETNDYSVPTGSTALIEKPHCRVC